MARSNPLLIEPPPQRRARRLAAGSLLVTATSVFLVRLLQWEPDPLEAASQWRALLFTMALLGVLAVHELGHYGVGRAFRVRLSLPVFLPAPFLIGTFGAVIRLEETPRTRHGLLAMGAAGPLAGAVATAGLVIVSQAVGPLAEGGTQLGRPLLWQLGGALSGAAARPVDTADPLAFAAWLGCLLTALNLLPIGQLDGGHVIAALWPERARAIGRVATAALLVAGLWWPGWAVWAALTWWMGGASPTPTRSGTPPPASAALWTGLACVLVWALVVTPVPA